MSRCLRRLALLALLLGVLMPGRPAQAVEAGRYVAEHLSFEVAGVGGWRGSWADERSPGFHITGGGGELNIGLEFDNGLGFLIGGRALFETHLGSDSQLAGLYADVVGQVIGILRISDWVRVGLGANVGRLWPCCSLDATPTKAALLAGGFLRVGVDFLPRTSLPRALSLWLRLGVDGHRPDDAMSLLPQVSMNLTVGIGMRL